MHVPVEDLIHVSTVNVIRQRITQLRKIFDKYSLPLRIRGDVRRGYILYLE